MRNLKTSILLLVILLCGQWRMSAQEARDSILKLPYTYATLTEEITVAMQPTHCPDTTSASLLAESGARGSIPSLYRFPYSLTASSPDWHSMWINTSVLAGAYVGTLFVLECLPEDATTWNRAELRKDPFYKRWYENVFKRGPEWDHDNPIFNYVLHPYAGAAYFMSARSTGFNFWQSFLYSACISTIGWEFGIEACMERPSIQDIFVTPIAGSIIGELFYKLKREIVGHDYRLFGSPVIGNIVVFLIDPVNEVINLFRGSPTRRLHLGQSDRGVSSSLVPTIGQGRFSLTLTCRF
ncbi:MAG: DUF3943 domain-containing protein [Muribaculaceae bacterium]|nr:DUF3943 domain-containing protein [Muribaculaceae bacterium]